MVGAAGIEPTDLPPQNQVIVKESSPLNFTSADFYFGRGQSILKQRERIKLKTTEPRRLQHRKYAA
jgi:hypothetical protein